MTHPWQHLLQRLNEIGDELQFDVTHRPMFGGAMIYADGSPIASLSHAGFAVKLSGDCRDELLAVSGTAPLRYSPDAPASRTYVVLAPAIVSDDDQLAHWLNAAAAQAQPDGTATRRRRSRSSS